MDVYDTLLNDRYQPLRVLSQKTSGKTILAQDCSQTPPVLCVIQPFLHWETGEDLATIAVKLTQLCAHPQLPTFLDCFSENEHVFGVFEWKVGRTLEQVLAEEGVFSPARLWQFLSEALKILQWIHGHQVIHGDLNPAHFLYCLQADSGLEKLVLVDFSALKPATAVESISQAIANDPEYAAPEQFRGQLLYNSDLYSLGVIGMHLLTDLRPFDLYDGLSSRWLWRAYVIWNLEDGTITPPQAALATLLEQLAAPLPSQRIPSAEVALKALHQIQLQPQITFSEIPSAIAIPQPTIIPPWESFAVLTASTGQLTGSTLAIHPLGRILACGGEHHTLHLWDLPEGKSLGILQTSSLVRAIAFSAELLFIGGKEGTLQVWNVDTRARSLPFSGHSQAITALSVSPDGQILLSGSADKTLKIWEIATQKLLTTLKGHRLSVTAIVHSPCQSLVATASLDSTVRLWDLQANQEIAALTAHTRAVRAVAFHPSGKWLASGGDDNLIYLWEVASGRKLLTLSAHAWNVSGLVFTPDGQQLISSSWDKTIKVWSIDFNHLPSAHKTLQPTAILVGHEDSIVALGIAIGTNIAQAPDQQQILVSYSRDRTIRLWRHSGNSPVYSVLYRF